MRKALLLLLSLFLCANCYADEDYVGGYKFSNDEVTQHTGIPAPAVSPSGSGRIYFDSTDNKYKFSENGAAYVNFGTGSGGSGGDLTPYVLYENSTASIVMGSYDVSGRYATFSSLFATDSIIAGSIGVGTLSNAYYLPTGSGSTGQSLTFQTGGTSVWQEHPSDRANIIYVPFGANINTYIAMAKSKDTIVLAAGDWYIDYQINVDKPLTIMGMGYDNTQLINLGTPDLKIFYVTADNVMIMDMQLYLGCSGSIGVYFDGTAASDIFQNVNVMNTHIVGYETTQMTNGLGAIVRKNANGWDDNCIIEIANQYTGTEADIFGIKFINSNPPEAWPGWPTIRNCHIDVHGNNTDGSVYGIYAMQEGTPTATMTVSMTGWNIVSASNTATASTASASAVTVDGGYVAGWIYSGNFAGGTADFYELNDADLKVEMGTVQGYGTSTGSITELGEIVLPLDMEMDTINNNYLHSVELFKDVELYGSSDALKFTVARKEGVELYGLNLYVSQSAVPVLASTNAALILSGGDVAEFGQRPINLHGSTVDIGQNWEADGINRPFRHYGYITTPDVHECVYWTLREDGWYYWDREDLTNLKGMVIGGPLHATEGIIMTQIGTPANPSSGTNKLYFKNDDKLYKLDSAGNEVEVGSGTGSTDLSGYVPYTGATSSVLMGNYDVSGRYATFSTVYATDTVITSTLNNPTTLDIQSLAEAGVHFFEHGTIGAGVDGKEFTIYRNAGYITTYLDQYGISKILTSGVIDFRVNDGAGTMYLQSYNAGNISCFEYTSRDKILYLYGDLSCYAATGTQLNITGTTILNTSTTSTLCVDATNSDYYLPYEAGSTGQVLTLQDDGTSIWQTPSTSSGGGYTNLTEFVDQTAWRFFYSNGDGDVTELALGENETYLRSNGAGEAPSWDSIDAGVTSLSATTKDITQASHSLSTGDVVRLDGTSYIKAVASSATGAEVVGIVSAVESTNVFTLLTQGYIENLSGLTAGNVYFLSDSLEGGVMATEPVLDGYISKPLILADDTDSGYFYNMRGIGVSAYDPIYNFTFPISGILYKVTNAMGVPFIIPFDCTVVKCRANLEGGPYGDSILFDINYDADGGPSSGASTIWTTQTNRIEVATNANTAVATTFDVTNLVAGGTMTIDVDRVGSTVTGSGACVTLTVRKTGSY